MNNYFKNKEKVIFLSKYCPNLVFIAYIVTIILLLVTKDHKLINFTIYPALVFLFVTILRIKINVVRPYDRYAYEPIIPYKKGKGKSFPSRHTASAWIIAIAMLDINIYMGIFMIFYAILISLLRIISGMHYSRDVAFAIIISTSIGVIPYIF